MPSRSALRWLLRKEWRELLSSRAWWVFLGAMGPLVGVSFISAVRTYAELSDAGGTASGVGEAFSPLIGIWAPTFSACELAAAFLLPFVAIRVVAGDRQSGALKLELQRPMSAVVRVGAKALVLAGGWSIASLPPLIAVALWRAWGGSIYAPELLTVALGHVLNAGLTIALAAATASLTEHPSTAAILTLGVTVGTWILNFIAAVHGGPWERAAGYTPTAMVAEFQHGLIRLDVLAIALVFTAAGLGLSGIWMRLGTPVRRRLSESLALGLVTAGVILACTRATASWDTSEDRRNSFRRVEEAALRTVPGTLRVQAYLAPEDPRRFDLERNALSKLRRLMPDLRVEYISRTSTGLFEQADAHYGEIWYELGGRRAMSRTTTTEGVLDTIFGLAGVEPAGEESDDVFRGHPLAARPAGAPWIFYIAWPAAVVATAFIHQRRHA